MALHMVRVNRGTLNPEGYRDVDFRWSSILSGAVITLGFAVFFLLIGNAIGLNIYNTVSPAVSGGLKFWSWLYSAVTLVLAYGLGSSLSARTKDPMTSGAHGIASWGLATLVGSVLLASLSLTARSVFEGTGADTGNWLAVCVVVFGLFSSVSGSMVGKSAQYPEETKTDEYTIDEKRKSEIA